MLFQAAGELGLSGDALDPAEQGGLVVIAGERLSFRHPLVRSAVYESATFSDRRRAHAALAAACSAEMQIDRRVWHQAIATLTPDEAIAAELEASAKRFRVRGGHASAATAYERAAKLSQTEPARVRRLVDAAGSAFVAGQIERARGLVDQSLPTADRSSRADLLALRGVIDGYGGSLADAVSSLLEGIELSDDASSSLEMLLEACAMATYLADYDQLLRLCLRAARVLGHYRPRSLHGRAAQRHRRRAQRRLRSRGGADDGSERNRGPPCEPALPYLVGRLGGAGGELGRRSPARRSRRQARPRARVRGHAPARPSGAGLAADRPQPLRPSVCRRARGAAASARPRVPVGGGLGPRRPRLCRRRAR